MSRRAAAAALARETRRFLSAVQLLTRLPVPDPGWEPARMLRASRYFALVGALIGGATGLAWLAAAALLPPLAAAFVALGAGFLVTGALHEDGLADCADGLFAASDPRRALEIMRDSRLGSYGALALIVVVGTRAGALAALAPVDGAVALELAGAIGRAAMVPATAFAPYARADGLGRALAAGPGPVEIAAALATAAVAALAGGIAGGAAFLAGAAMAALTLRWLIRRIGGYTGDGLGAIAATAETAALAGFAAAA